jgi:hypothetical protein
LHFSLFLALSSPTETSKANPPTTMRQLKHHEQKLLKKVDFLNVSTGSARSSSLLKIMPVEPQTPGTSLTRPVEAGCVVARNQGDAKVSHPRSRRLPQVRVEDLLQNA